MFELRDVPAPAKINLFLHVVGRRADGYHLLQTVFRFISLQDTLHFRGRHDGRIARIGGMAGVAEHEDLAVRAALALQQATGCTQGADIKIEKRIPAGGGLGGGSSDAATVLLALNRLWGTGLSRDQLMQLALPLGADVPVFVFGRNAFAEGVGEQLQPLTLPARWYVVVQPDASVATADIFRAPELTRDTAPVKIADFSSSTYNFVAGNDLEAVVFARFPEVARIAKLMEQVSGAEKVRMSGSGACLFVEYGDQSQADWAACEIAATIRSQPGGLSALRVKQVCAGLDEHPLLDWAS